MVLDQAGSANIGCDNTRERNLVAIKRLRGIRKGSMRRIRPFTSDHVVSIRDKHFENDDLVIIYERMDVSLRHVTGILQDPFKPSQIAAICKQLVAGLSYIHEELSLCHGELSCGTILLNLDGMVKIGKFSRLLV
jgi:serine/threonine protein kinase